MKRSKGYRSRTRQLFRKGWSACRMSVSSLLREYNIGDRVVIQIEPSKVKGQPHRRYHGKVGVISEKRGRAYVLSVQDGGKVRQVISMPDHLKPL
ncbi:MAG: 50S ribosomal protein L21e [Candidatus Bathyarchaeia archaeon]